MRRQPKTYRVFPNPWGVHPRSLFDVDPKTKKRSLKAKVPAAEAFTMDAEGRPNGAVLEEVTSRSVPTVARYIGARLDGARTVLLDKPVAGDNLRSIRQRTVFSFMGATAHETEPHGLAKAFAIKAPVTVTASRYYIDRIRDGSLLAADEDTAKAAQVEYHDPKRLFPLLSEAAAKGFSAQYEGGSDVYAELCAERAEAAKAPAEAEPEPSAETAADLTETESTETDK